MHQLTLSIAGNELALALKNQSTDELRVWLLGNSWGARTIFIEVKDAGGRVAEIAPKERIFTRNGPGFATIPAGDEYRIRLDLGDGEWETGPLGKLDRGGPLSLRARWTIGPTPESAEHKVFVGTIHSNWVTSSPPHPEFPAS